MKVKITNEQLQVLHQLFAQLDPSHGSRETRVRLSILSEVRVKVAKSFSDVALNLDLFSKAKKKQSLTITYHHAHYLEQFLLISVELISTPYERRIMQNLIDQLNKQLS